MRLTTKCSIALHCLIVIYEYEPKRKVTSDLLGKSTGCNAAAVRSILKSLQKAGIISVSRGVGGAHLNCIPSDLTVWDVYHAVEPNGLEHFIGVHPRPSHICPVGHNIDTILSKTYTEIGNSVRQTMQNITLQDLLNNYHICLENQPKQTEL